LYNKKFGQKFIVLAHSDWSRITFYLVFSHFGPKFRKYESKMCKKPLIYCEIPEKIPLWANFSKTAPVAILKIPIF
jgi:hypothetical protein